MANCIITATGVDSRVSSCGNAYFCCYEDNSTACCGTPSKRFFLGVATVVTTITGPSSMSATTNSRTSATSAAVSTSNYPCPDLDGTSYTDATGSSYKIQCGTHYSGNDLPEVSTDTIEKCLEICDTYVPSPNQHNYAPCIGVSWAAGNPVGSCYLKYQITAVGLKDGGFQSGYYVNYTRPNSAVTSQGSSLSLTSAPATSSTHSAASTILHMPNPSRGSDSHVAGGVGAGVGIPVGLAILAGVFYLVRRQSKTRLATLLKIDTMANHKNDDRLRESWVEGRSGELSAENKPTELSDPSEPRAELQETCG